MLEKASCWWVPIPRILEIHFSKTWRNLEKPQETQVIMPVIVFGYFVFYLYFVNQMKDLAVSNIKVQLVRRYTFALTRNQQSTMVDFPIHAEGS